MVEFSMYVDIMRIIQGKGETRSILLEGILTLFSLKKY